MPKFEPEDFHKDPLVNALLNIAASLELQAQATDNLLYALKYSKNTGLSLAEAIEKAGEEIGGSVRNIAERLSE